ncbi:hypothetical protein TNCV_113681 [Trichonephila clavipes]|nr:hypothetical protein TNCV_113681 [Trichonephila clavipes]
MIPSVQANNLKPWAIFQSQARSLSGQGILAFVAQYPTKPELNNYQDHCFLGNSSNTGVGDPFKMSQIS